jgi:hypothetical protein
MNTLRVLAYPRANALSGVMGPFLFNFFLLFLLFGLSSIRLPSRIEA